MFTYKNENKKHQSVANSIQENGQKSNPVQFVDNRKSSKRNVIIQRVNSDDEGYEPDSDDDHMMEPDEIYRAPNISYRGSRSFYTGKKQDTRKSLVERQTDINGDLRSGFGGSGSVIKLDSQGREIRTHKKKTTKNKQPDIDHIVDFLAIDDEADRYDESDLSSDEMEEYKNYLYNYQDNLEILSKDEHKSKKRFRRDTISKTIRKKAKKMVKEKRKDFKADPDAIRRLKIRRRKSKRHTKS